MSQELKTFCEIELQRLETEKKEASSFHKLNQGENLLVFMAGVPTIKEKWAEKKMMATFNVVVGEETKLFDVNTKSPAYREIIRKLKDGVYNITIIVTGKGSETRWEVKE